MQNVSLFFSHTSRSQSQCLSLGRFAVASLIILVAVFFVLLENFCYCYYNTFMLSFTLADAFLAVPRTLAAACWLLDAVGVDLVESN